MIRIKRGNYIYETLVPINVCGWFITNRNSVAYLLVCGATSWTLSKSSQTDDIFVASIGLCQFLSLSVQACCLYCPTAYWCFGTAVMTSIKSVFEWIPAYFQRNYIFALEIRTIHGAGVPSSHPDLPWTSRMFKWHRYLIPSHAQTSQGVST